MTADASTLARAAAARNARVVLRKARTKMRRDAVHRSIAHQSLDVRAVAESLMLAIVLAAGLWRSGDWVLERWRDVMLFWAPPLGLALQRTRGLLVWAAPEPQPTRTVLAITAALVVFAWSVTYRLPDAATPLKYLIRIVCAVQASAVGYTLLVNGALPHGVAAHAESILTSSFAVMCSVPALMALGYGLLHIPLRWRLLHPLLVVGFLAIETPHLATLHVVVLRSFSLLTMPVLYLCFGVLFQTMVFVALYSWLVSRLPPDVLG